MLGVGRKPDSQFFQGTRADWQTLTGAVMERDGHVCQVCGFVSRRFQKIRRVEGAKGRAADSWMTICPQCDQCLSLESVAGMRSGTLIWLPEISQVELNHVTRALLTARTHPSASSELKAAAKAGYDSLLTRRGDAKRRLGTDDPAILACVMMENMDDAAYAARAAKLEGVRLLPLEQRLIQTPTGPRDQYPALLAWWQDREGPFEGFAPSSWAGALQGRVGSA
ncbi:MAG: type IV secretion protein DotN [Alphaproteobacteria bacterium]|nr:MAG: type IV secretion protein DotN [Alphaproteobacteria bacterium]